MGRKYIQNTQTTLGSLAATLTLAPGLQFKSILGVNIQTQEVNQSQTRTLNIGGNGNASVNNRKETFWSLENLLTYNKQFGAGSLGGRAAGYFVAGNQRVLHWRVGQ